MMCGDVNGEDWTWEGSPPMIEALKDLLIGFLIGLALVLVSAGHVTHQREVSMVEAEQEVESDN